MMNLGNIKCNLMNEGLSVVTGSAPDIVIGEEILISLDQDFFVRTVAVDAYRSPYALHLNGEDTVISYEKESIPAEIIPPPQFLSKRTQDDPILSNICLDGYCLNFFLRVLPSGELNLKQDDILSFARETFAEGLSDLIQLNLEYHPSADRGFSLLVPIIKSFKKNFRTFVAYRGFPPDQLQSIDKIYAAGVDLLVFPFECFTEESGVQEIASDLCVQKFLDYAADIFSQGCVSTECVFQEGQIETLLQKISEEANKGIISKIRLPDHSLSTESNMEKLRQVAKFLARSAADNRLTLKWLYPMGRFLTPLDSLFYLEKTGKLSVQPIYKSSLGKTASEGFAALRRKLRVKNISDSYESAGL